jgi:hypothetical protein
MTDVPASEHAAADDLPERPAFLLLVAGAPAVWVVHFLLTYIGAAVWCARFAGANGSLDPIRIGVAVITAAALAAIVLIGAGGYRRHRHGTETEPHDSDTPEDRHRFLGFATLLLAGLSFVATVYVAFGALAFDRCW